MAPTDRGDQIRPELSTRLTAWLCSNEVSLAAALGIILAVRLWISPLPSSFWMDETGTVWSVTGGIKDVIAHWQADFPVMPLHSLLTWAWSRVAGMSEVALRLLSVIEVSLAALLLWKAARRLTGRVTAAYTLLLLASLSHVSFAAADARPYALALLCAAWVFFETVRFIQTGRTVHAVLQGIALGLAMNSHYGYGVLIAPLAVYILVAHRRGWSQMRPALLISPLVALLIFAPAVPLFVEVARTQRTHSFASQPSWTDLAAVLIPPRWIVSAVVGLGAAWMLARRKMPANETADTRVTALLGIWTVVPVLILFVYSLLSGTAVMVPRYLLSQTPGIVLLGAYMMSRLRAAELRITVAVVLFAISIAGSGKALWTRHATDDWRAASAAMNRLRNHDVSLPVLMGSPFIESIHMPMPVPPGVQDYLLAPLKPYPIDGPVTLLPVEMNSRNAEYVHAVFESAAGSNRFLVLIPSASGLTRWVYGRFDREFAITEIQPDPIVLLLERRGARAAILR